VQVPVPSLHSAAVAQGEPMLVHPVCAELHTSGWDPLQRVAPAVHAAVLQVPVTALHNPAVEQALPRLLQPVCCALQI
jgi:hypothetical protein